MNQQRAEQCAYKVLRAMDEACKEVECNGYNNYCLSYITLEHLKQFQEMFGDGNDKLENNLEGGKNEKFRR